MIDLFSPAVELESQVSCGMQVIPVDFQHSGEKHTEVWPASHEFLLCQFSASKFSR